MQTKTHSFYEALTNTALGFIISLSATFVIFPLLDIPTTSGQNVVITLFFTVISIIRGYVIRRWFNDAPTVATDPAPRMHCFECEMDMPIDIIGQNIHCSNCGLKHDRTHA